MTTKSSASTKAKESPSPLSEDELDPVQNPFFSPRRLAEIGFGDHETILRAVKAGTIPSIRYERSFKVPTRWVRKALGLDVDEPASA
jgi:hypothetical protein